MAPSKPKRQPRSQRPSDDNPWDAASAEALTRAYEQSEAEWQKSRTTRRPPNDRGMAQQQPGPSSGSADLERRLAEITERLQRSVAGIEADKSAASLGQRIDELENRLSEAFQEVSRRLEGQKLESIEAQIGSLASHLEHTRNQLARLDAMDEHVRQLATQIEEQRQLHEQTRLDQDTIEAIIEAAADRAANRAVRSMSVPAPAIDPQRIHALEGLMQDQMAERRRAEEMTAGVLRSIEESLSRIMDRVEVMDPGSFAPLFEDPRHVPQAHEGASLDPLHEAYVQGARALGRGPASELSATDYATTSAPAAPPRMPQEPAADKRHGEGNLDAPKPDEATEDKSKPRGFASGRRSSLLLILAVLAMSGVGYLGVDLLLAHVQMPLLQDRTVLLSSLSVQPTPASVKEGEVVREPLAPQDGARIGDLADSLPEVIGAVGLRKAAIDGDPVAQYEVAARLLEGRGVPQSDVQAFAWFQRAAAKGYAPAQFRTAALLERGVGVSTDIERAKVWYRRAAEQTHIKSMHNLAVLCARTDFGIAPNYAMAAQWFEEAAERGLVDSQYNLGLLYLKGLGVNRHLPSAYKWLALAAKGGDKEAEEHMEQVKAHLMPAELAAVQQEVAAWRVRSTPVGAGPQPAPTGGVDAEVGG